ncbi:MAG: dipeptidase [Candidatus Omnitrophica bacterium]|nr:dipeptidase [Candidatus Omnitrophota bacterium]
MQQIDTLSGGHIEKMNICADLHYDVPVDFVIRYEKGERQIFSKYHLEKFRQGGVNFIIAPIYVELWYKPEKALRRGLEILDIILEEIETTTELVMVKDFQDFKLLDNPDKIGIMIGVEGGELIEDSFYLLDIYYKLGVRCFGFVHGEPNLIADAGSFQDSKRGIFEFGKMLIEELEKKEWIIDGAHLPSIGLDQLIELTKKPFLISHTLLENPGRNVGLSECQIIKLARKGCLIGLAALNIHPENEKIGAVPDIQEYVRWLNYVKSITGSVDCIGFGFDFYDFLDPDFIKRRFPGMIFDRVEGLEGVQNVKNLFPLLKDAGYSEKEIEKMKGGNLMNFLRNLWGVK